DRSPRKPGRLPDAAHGAQVRSPVQRVHHLRDQPEAGIAGRRGVPPPHPVQDSREESHGERVHPDLRPGLPQAQRGVRPRDGRVPPAQVLPAAQAAYARLPSARPGGAGDRHVPLPAARAGDHPRAARRGVRELLPGRNRIPGKRAIMKRLAFALPVALTRGVSLRPVRFEASRGPARQRDWGELASKATIVTLFSMMAMRISTDFARTGHVTGLLLVASEALVVVLTVFRRSAGIVDRSLRARILTMMSMFG